MDKLTGLPNIGPEVAKQLEAVGILTIDDLKRVGAKEAWLRILAIDSSACIHRLYGLQGAIFGISKRELAIEEKQELKEFYKLHK